MKKKNKKFSFFNICLVSLLVLTLGVAGYMIYEDSKEPTINGGGGGNGGTTNISSPSNTNPDVSSPSSPGVEQVDYYIYINDERGSKLEINPEASPMENLIAEYMISLELSAGYKVDFGSSTEAKNVWFENSETNTYTVTEYGLYTFYLKTWQDGGLSCWVNFENVHTYSLFGSFNEWNAEDDSYLLNKVSTNVYSFELTAENANTEFKIAYDFSSTYSYGKENVKIGQDLINLENEDGNIELLTAGNYYIELNDAEISIVKYDVSTLAAHLKPITDTWGENSSVECKEENVVLGSNYYSASINVDNQYSSCLLSQFYYGKGQFNIWANVNIYDYGTFAFWLTGVEDDVDNPFQEATFELFKQNQINCASGSNSQNYTSHNLTADFDFNEWHKYSINIDDEKIEFKVDDVVIYTITENIPTCEYFKVNVGLLYPKTGWTGFIEDTKYNICDMKITNFSGSSI